MTSVPSPRGIDWLMVAALGLTWGGTFMVIEIALEGITPFWLAAARITFAALLTTALWQWQGGKLFDAPPDRLAKWRLSMVSLLSSALPFALLSWGQQYVTSSFAGVSMACVALIVLPLAHQMIPGEQMNARKVLGFVVGFLGVYILIGGEALSSTGQSLELWGRAACLGAATCYALSSVQMRLLPKIDSVGLSAVTLANGAVLVIVAALIAEGSPPMPDSKTLIVLAFLGLVPTAAANLLRVSVIRNAGPTFMSLTNYQVPVWSIILGALILGEPLPNALFIALALVLMGLALSQFYSLKRLFTGG